MKSSRPSVPGDIGEVYRARDTCLGRIVAIRKVKKQHSERFKQEATIVGGELVEGVPIPQKGHSFQHICIAKLQIIFAAEKEDG
jgi:serine/threonine protein kinase